MIDQLWKERKAELQELLDLDAAIPRCWYCGSESPGGSLRSFIREHMTPKSRGGSDLPSNVAASCSKCNRNKGSYTVAEWRQKLSNLKPHQFHNEKALNAHQSEMPSIELHETSSQIDEDRAVEKALREVAFDGLREAIMRRYPKSSDNERDYLRYYLLGSSLNSMEDREFRWEIILGTQIAEASRKAQKGAIRARQEYAWAQ